MKKRIISSIILFLSIFFLPWWGMCLVSIAFVFLFRKCYELIFVGVISDIVYGSSPYLGGYYFTFTTIFVIVFVLSEYFKKRLILD
ncbi:hypothetical protein IT397_01975 [Candidatus Nomurabacteria bacterium]|nr:hypothetical protein [Candidatus Nomurabacteria bacterium]